jgi:dipeptidyl aminopeptidase/acylaminoacyl peptidase
MEKKVTTFKEFTYSRPETTKFPKSIMKKGSDSLQRYKKLGGDSNLKKAMADAEKIVPIRQTPKQLRQFLTILKKKYKEYGGKDKDLLNSFTEKLEQKISESFKESIEEKYKPEVKKAESELIKTIQAYTYLPISTNENAIDKSLKQLKDVIKKLKGKTRT